MAQVLVAVKAEKDPGRLGQPSLADVGGISPARRAVGRDQLGLPRAPDRHGDGNAHGDHAAGAGNGAAGVEDLRCIGAEKEPPLKQHPRVVDRRAKEVEPGRAKAYLIAKGRCCPLCGAPHAGDHDAEHYGDLTEQHVRPLHDLASDVSCADTSSKTAHMRTARSRISAGSVPVKDLYRDKTGLKNINSCVRKRREDHAGASALRRTE
ncbi:hypothetical protein D3C81_846750 [compost metagenome]